MRNMYHHFSVGRISVSLRSECRSFIDEYTSLYRAYCRATPGDNAIKIEISAGHRFPWRRGPFVIHSDEADDFEVRRRHEVLPHLEWIINWQIIRQRAEYVQLHASTLTWNDGAILLPGDPGSGKSTLAAGLLARGWSYLCDEFALIDPHTRRIEPFPRALCIKEPSFAVIDDLGIPLHRKTPYHKPTKGRVAFLNPLDVRPDVVGRASEVRWVVFPKYVANATPTLTPMPRSEAAYELVRQCFNFRDHTGNAVALLADVARFARCFRLTAGEINATCDLIQKLADGRTTEQRRCA